MDQIIERLLYSYLITIKQNAPQFSDEQQSQIIELCGRYLMAGFILESNRLDPSNAHLVKCLEGQRRVMAIKNMSMKQDLAKIYVFNVWGRMAVLKVLKTRLKAIEIMTVFDLLFQIFSLDVDKQD